MIFRAERYTAAVAWTAKKKEKKSALRWVVHYLPGDLDRPPGFSGPGCQNVMLKTSKKVEG